MQLEYYNMVLAEVIFRTQAGVQMLSHQFFEKSLESVFPAHRIQMIQRTAAFKVQQSLPESERESYTALDVHIRNITPLGQMTEEQFWAGIGEQEAAAAVSQEPLPGTPDDDGSNVTPIR